MRSPIASDYLHTLDVQLINSLSGKQEPSRDHIWMKVIYNKVFESTRKRALDYFTKNPKTENEKQETIVETVRQGN